MYMQENDRSMKTLKDKVLAYCLPMTGTPGNPGMKTNRILTSETGLFLMEPAV